MNEPWELKYWIKGLGVTAEKLRDWFKSTASQQLKSGRLKAGTKLKMREIDVYSIIGAEGFVRLVAAFYRQVPKDDLLAPMYPANDLRGAEQRLRDFLIYRFGGPQDYIEKRGHPRLRARHFPFQISRPVRDRWMLLMNNALTEAALPGEAEQVLRRFFDDMSTFMINHEEAVIE